MPRPLTVLLKDTGVAVAVVAVVASSVPVAVAQTPTRDSVVAVGSTASFSSIDVRLTSGPSGENPVGTTTVVFGDLTYRGSGRAGCLRVNGNTATLAGPVSGNPGFPYGKATVVDRGAGGDTFAAMAFPTRVGCSTPTTSLSGPLLTGDVVVVDAHPTSAPLRASLRAAPGPPHCAWSAVTVTVRATGGTRLTRVTLSLDGRPVAQAKRRRLEVRLPLSGLRPGPHALRAVALDSAGDAARAVRTVRRCRNAPFTG
jgi:hypothetical protein